MLSDKAPFPNQDNNPKVHNYFETFCILKSTCKYHLAGFGLFFVKWLLVAASFASTFEGWNIHRAYTTYSILVSNPTLQNAAEIVL